MNPYATTELGSADEDQGQLPKFIFVGEEMLLGHGWPVAYHGPIVASPEASYLVLQGTQSFSGLEAKQMKKVAIGYFTSCPPPRTGESYRRKNATSFDEPVN